ncbi:Lrp/AsnC family transcriptional regulator [Winslowiella iniecta]|uniref:AsnC family transcriptional regulator n=1 Tax=Winslowiella iniecta TaxID=1560201 RepID=A0A0L7SXK0_9GAMM|nr:AsnC family transcriptional regulator [Winslowiella iniecta]KOC89858.1 AsnC family transcriptional regulator [Winslowiella iniecta]
MGMNIKEITLLSALQSEGRMTNQELADRSGMAASPCWRRIRQFEQQGVIKGYQANLDRKKLGFGILAFIRIKIDSHNAEQAMRFESDVRQLPQVIACYATAGSSDFLLQVVERDLEHYSDFAMTVIRRLPGIKEMETTFVLRELKQAAGLPVEMLR